MKGHYFFKWLFLTVLSVSVLHFRENSSIGHYNTEQLFSGQRILQKRVPGYEYCQKLSKVRPASSVYFKNTQYNRLTELSNSLTILVSGDPELRLQWAFAAFHVQNQHFRSRSLTSDDHSIFRSEFCLAHHAGACNDARRAHPGCAMRASLHTSFKVKWKMGIKRTVFFLRKWLLRMAISFMLGFSNAINQDTKSIDDTAFKIEETTKK